MNYGFETAVPVLRRTPKVLNELLIGLPDQWTHATEGAGSWSPYDVVGHLIHGERTDWMPRVEHLLEHGERRPFPTFARDAMFTSSRGKSLGELLDTFVDLRTNSLARLAALRLTASDLDRRGTHPEFGSVTLRQHLATWVVHDLGHIAQCVRTMASQYGAAVGPWQAYLSILGKRPTS